jgi:malic enzyme
MFLDAARALAGLVHEDDLADGAVYPRLSRIRECSHAVACAVVRRAVQEGHADAAVLDGLEARVQAAMWEPVYLPFRCEPIS